ncbi:MAG: glycosyltransferase family 4 protein [Acidimicrobiales bacterium]
MSTAGRPEGLSEPQAPHHLLVTNDFPPKVGGIQSYLWELWRRLPPGSFTVLTIGHPGAAAFDRAQPFRVVRLPARMLLPTPALAHQVKSLAAEVGAGLVVLDPAVPLGVVGLRLGLPYAVVLHGAEVSIPGRLPLTSNALARVLRSSVGAICAGDWVRHEATRVAAPSELSTLTITPGVDHTRFAPLSRPQRLAARERLGLPRDGDLVLSVGRLVPRKGTATLVDAITQLAPSRPELTLAIAGSGRERARLERRSAVLGPRCVMLGRVPDSALPALYGAADIFAQPTCTRWAGLEQEGFGIVFVEAAACGVPAVAGRGGGSAEAVIDGVTGLVVDRPRDPTSVARAIAALLDDATKRDRLGTQARERVESELTYDILAARLAVSLSEQQELGKLR